VRKKVSGGPRHTHCRKIRGRRKDAPLAFTNFARSGGGPIGEPAYQQRHVYAGCDEVDVAVVQKKIDIEQGVFSKESGKARHDIQAREGKRSGAQFAWLLGKGAGVSTWTRASTTAKRSILTLAEKQGFLRYAHLGGTGRRTDRASR
jgi:hypothetical protein